MSYDTIIGMEIHAELKTKSKMFCSCDNNAQGKAANTMVCPICMAHPGTLPVPNKQAVEWTILIGLVLNCKINKLSKFDRKNYFYPDLPKGYQISQYDLPIAYDGFLEVDGKPILITRIHLEEDTGKLIHPTGKKYSLVDYNRAGTPLVEMVTEPIIKDAATAKKFAQNYRQILKFLDISNADMEKGEMRCEANISIQEIGKWKYDNGQIKPIGSYKLNPKVELKNINSFKYMEKAIDYEIKRQVKALTDDEKLIQETRGWNNKKGITFRQRVKETSADYRYFPEPDIPPLKISQEWIDEIKCHIDELPAQKIQRFKHEYLFTDIEAEILARDKTLAGYTEKVISELRAWIESSGDSWERQKHKLAKITANLLINELFKHLKADGRNISQLKVTAENFAEFICLIYQDKINSSAAQTILAKMYQDGGDPTNIMADLGLEQLDDQAALEKIIAEVVFKNQKQVEQYKSGKENILQFLVGQIMAATKGKANPKLLIKILKDILDLLHNNS
ncbi:Asp-tRNA(Asn)/Glu-tRNA(Gln) amidotransferase subunit GatB [Patescibacteria group bacterium]|nr:Asp-tRNA(Asn)/Glu-tRNA(Gln) amidotransferase subunit GatB [Patescibacteria group bacterium]MBU1663540.1 Asp-tRNA(Asn)/Glu-tRNA(Gln) amidotransferase subunit GatB [Patescibacteria group bacterium]MBU1933802.1 Asp-tRNA(Asn)/Glu-tRNA(Gln) amidotransferase subunit GatB [Patescibacteria group bacterium]MBU2007806.1 Asp-tRNA(Asn)/Glu-tRNA(Gln) amidotransferase subunit GatB [Patescibacteria group bacterium]MBU2233444.1 Asp-tRNA(Asn)/Glu-tRNA(Gln) amidotransferase subunit GatB [Patescibacteria group